jgi:hypothetical protein
MRVEKSRLCGSVLSIDRAELFDLLWVKSPDKNASLSNKVRTIDNVIEKNPENPCPFTDYQYKWIFEKVRQYVISNGLFPDCKITEVRVEV